MKLHRVFILKSKAEAKACWGFIKAHAKACAEAGRPLAVEVTEHRDKRTHGQNARYWVLLNQIADQAMTQDPATKSWKRYDAEIWHEFFKRHFLGAVDLPDGTTMAVSTGRQSIEEFTEYMNKVEAYAAHELNVVLDVHR